MPTVQPDAAHMEARRGEVHSMNTAAQQTTAELRPYRGINTLLYSCTALRVRLPYELVLVQYYSMCSCCVPNPRLAHFLDQWDVP
eukprot:COSAG01_NODE_61629_length_288_cov_1.481481_1_plen_84_part_01